MRIARTRAVGSAVTEPLVLTTALGSEALAGDFSPLSPGTGGGF